LRVKKVSKEQRRREPQNEKYKIRPHMAWAEDDVSPPKKAWGKC